MALNRLLEYAISVRRVPCLSLVSKAQILHSFLELWALKNLFCLICVDDIIFLGTSMHLVSSSLQELEMRFFSRNLGKLNYFLSIEAT